MSIGNVARGGLYLFIALFVGSILGWVYWLLILHFGGAEMVGIASSVYSLSSVVAGIAVLGLPIGVQRFFGRDFALKRIRSLSTHFWSSFFLTIMLCVLSAVTIWMIAILDLPLLGFSNNMLISVGFIVLLSFYGIANALLVSIIKTWYIAVSYIAASLAKLGIGVILVLLGFGWFGAIVGIVSDSLVMVVLMLILALRQLKRLGDIGITLSFKALHESLNAGLVTWLPDVIALLGQQLGFLAVFGIQGGPEAGTYFIAYTIFGIIYVFPASIMSLLFPILSGLSDGGNVAWRTLKICLALACPPTAFLLFYPSFPLSLVGWNYVQAAPMLSLLASSIIPLILILAANNLVYALGSYKSVLGIGLALSIPRVVLYSLLVPLYGGFGASLSFVVGSLTGLTAAAYAARIANFRVSFSKITVAIATPFAAGLFCLTLGLNWLVSGITILATSVLCYARSGVVDRNDLREIAGAFVSEEMVAKSGARLRRLLRVLYGD